MGGVPQDDGLVLDVVGGALDADEGESSVGEEVRQEVLSPDQADRVSEVLIEETEQGLSVLEALEGGVGHEEGECEALVLVWKTFKYCSNWDSCLSTS